MKNSLIDGISEREVKLLEFIFLKEKSNSNSFDEAVIVNSFVN